MSRRRILIIDFDRRTRQAWASLLGGHGYEVAEACTGTEVAQRLQDAHPHLVIIEPMIPGQDGFALCRALKKDEETAPAVIIASRIFKGPRYRGLARDSGADLFLEKPVKDDLLVAMVTKMLPPPTPEEVAAAAPPEPEPAVAPPVDAQEPEPVPVAAPAAAAAAAQPLLDGVTDDDIEDAFGRLLAPDTAGGTPRAEAPVSTLTPPPPSALSQEEIASALDRLELVADAPGGTTEEGDAAPSDPPAPTDRLADELDQRLDATLGGGQQGAGPPEPQAEPAETPAGLRGMDPGTAELLSSLEELEQSLPETGEPSREPERGEIDTSVPYDPPPPPEEEQSLEEVLDSLKESTGAATTPEGPGDDEMALAPAAEIEEVGGGPAADPEARAGARASAGDPAPADRSRSRGGVLTALLLAVIGAGAGGYYLLGSSGRDPAATEKAARPVGEELAIPQRPVPEAARGLAGELPGRRPDPAAGRAPGARGEAEAPVRPTPEAAPASGPAREGTRPTARNRPARDGPGQAPRTGAGRKAARVVEVGELDRPLRLVASTTPRVPDGMAGEPSGARVFVKVLVGPDGNVTKAQVMMESSPGLGKIAAREVLTWRYTPPTSGGAPASVWKTEVVDFTP